MSPFEIFITCISWGTGSKKRPVLVLLIKSKSITVYPITTQYDNKSESIKNLSGYYQNQINKNYLNF